MVASKWLLLGRAPCPMGCLYFSRQGPGYLLLLRHKIQAAKASAGYPLLSFSHSSANHDGGNEVAIL